jgi:GNAT superfamily N-acetyltransferase
VTLDEPAERAHIRPARSDDAQSIAAVHVDSWRAAYPGLLPDAVLDGLSVGDRARHWERILGVAAPGQVVVAEVGDRLVGFAHVGPAHEGDTGPATGQLDAIYLHPDVWGTGVGRAVHDAGLDRLADDGFVDAVLWKLSTNARAGRFYERQGWVRDGRIRVQQFGGTVVVDHRFARGLPTR